MMIKRKILFLGLVRDDTDLAVMIDSDSYHKLLICIVRVDLIAADVVQIYNIVAHILKPGDGDIRENRAVMVAVIAVGLREISKCVKSLSVGVCKR